MIPMKKLNLYIKKFIYCGLIISLFITETTGQTLENLNEAIAKNRKGELIVKARKGQQVTVEQLRHEFWFGCAIPNSMAGGMKQDDLKKFKEKFLENFNSAVTENALKWAIMEPRKDQENFAVIDSILSFTERNNIPLRGHNLFWGILKSPNTGQTYIQSWVTELDDNELRQRIQSKWLSGHSGEILMQNYI